MKEISLNPDYKTMWKVECELNQHLKQQLEEAAEVMNTIEKMEEDEEYPATRISKAAKMCRQFFAKYRRENG